jgi:hypothetical protein
LRLRRVDGVPDQHELLTPALDVVKGVAGCMAGGRDGADAREQLGLPVEGPEPAGLDVRVDRLVGLGEGGLLLGRRLRRLRGVEPVVTLPLIDVDGRLSSSFADFETVRERPSG